MSDNTFDAPNPRCRHCGERKTAHLADGRCPRQFVKAEVVEPILTRAEEAKMRPPEAEPAGRPARSTALEALPPGERMVSVPATHYQDAERALEERIARVREEMERLRSKDELSMTWGAAFVRVTLTVIEKLRMERGDARSIAENALSELEAIGLMVGARPEETTSEAVKRYMGKAREELITATLGKAKPGAHPCAYTGPVAPDGYCPTCGTKVL